MSGRMKGGFRAFALGIISGAADDDPSAIGTYAAAGAKLGPSFLWTAPVTLPMMYVVIYLSAKLGQVSGRGLFSVIRDHYPRWLLYTVLLGVLVGNIIEAGADLGGMAAALDLFVTVPGPLTVVATALVVLALQFFGTYALIRTVFQWLALALLAYAGSAVLAKPELMAVLKGTFIPHVEFTSEFLSMIVAVIGTTLSAYLFSWQSNVEVEEKIEEGETTLAERKGTTDEALCRTRRDIWIGMMFSNLVMYFIILATERRRAAIFDWLKFMVEAGLLIRSKAHCFTSGNDARVPQSPCCGAAMGSSPPKRRKRGLRGPLLGSVACLVAVAGAQAADLPARKVEPAEYVRICASQGPGFFYIPGSDTCIRLGGRLRYEYVASKAANRSSDPSSFYALGRVSLDARSTTEWAPLRVFVRVDFSRRSGNNYFGSGSADRRGEAIGPISSGGFPGFASVDTSGDRLQTGVAVTDAFVQWGGFSAGRMQSFFEFYNGNDNWFGITDSKALTQAVAYTYTFGSGFSASLSIEDPKERQINPIAGFAAVGSGGVNPAVPTAPFTATYPFALSPYAAPALSPAGAGSAISYVQRESVPDVVGALRVDKDWGSAQLSGDYHRLSTVGATVISLTPAAGGGFVVNPLVPSVPGGYGAVHGNGVAVQGGLRINLPMIAAGDKLYVQAAYSKGNTNFSYMDYSFPSAFTGRAKAFGGTTFATYDGVVGPSGRLTLTPAFFASISVEHYWTPTIRQGFFVGREHIGYSGAIRTAAGFAAGAACPACLGTVTSANGSSYNPYSPFYAGGTLYNIGTTLVWSPVKNLDLGMEALYFRDAMAHRQFDANTGTGKLIKSDNALDYRLRVSRDF